MSFVWTKMEIWTDHRIKQRKSPDLCWYQPHSARKFASDELWKLWTACVWYEPSLQKLPTGGATVAKCWYCCCCCALHCTQLIPIDHNITLLLLSPLFSLLFLHKNIIRINNIKKIKLNYWTYSMREATTFKSANPAVFQNKQHSHGWYRGSPFYLMKDLSTAKLNSHHINSGVFVICERDGWSCEREKHGIYVPKLIWEKCQIEQKWIYTNWTSMMYYKARIQKSYSDNILLVI